MTKHLYNGVLNGFDRDITKDAKHVEISSSSHSNTNMDIFNQYTYCADTGSAGITDFIDSSNSALSAKLLQ